MKQDAEKDGRGKIGPGQARMLSAIEQGYLRSCALRLDKGHADRRQGGAKAKGQGGVGLVQAGLHDRGRAAGNGLAVEAVAGRARPGGEQNRDSMNLVGLGLEQRRVLGKRLWYRQRLDALPLQHENVRPSLPQHAHGLAVAPVVGKSCTRGHDGVDRENGVQRRRGREALNGAGQVVDVGKTVTDKERAQCNLGGSAGALRRRL